MNKHLASEINKYLADLSTMYFKAHNLHWNVVGKQFSSIHSYLEELYDGLAASLDEVAELLKKYDEYPLASMKDYLAVTSIKEIESKDVSVDDVLEILQEDITSLKTTANEIRKTAGQEDLFEVTSLMEDEISGYSKTLWFIKSMRK